MAKGKPKGVVSLKDTVPENEIVISDQIINEPNYTFPDGEYGIVGKDRCYSLVKKRIAYRTGKEEDGINCGKVISYTIFEDAPCYTEDYVNLFDAYARILNLTEFKTKKIKGDISEVVEIHQRTNNMISEALKGIDTYLSKEQEEVCTLADTKQELLNDIKELRQQKSEVIKILNDINKMHNEIKQAKVIIVDRDKPKKRKLKLEE